MGRHRSDPRGLARILIAAVAVALGLGLLAVGAIALVNALTSSSDQQSPPGAGSASPSAARSSPPAQAAGDTPLVIRAVGGSTLVTITDPGNNNDVVFRGTLAAGEGRKYDQAPLSVVAADGGAVQVTIYGKVEERPAGQRATWYVARK
ncbi:hypothetical protein [Actinomadura atramentaria]|uniref:hypothetical protein n=1 Tax=Actinomadura atramentaria TaxID=1990 RepID=UPI00037970BB|nr:hypothetical protein [Actinomadura atramentaria]